MFELTSSAAAAYQVIWSPQPGPQTSLVACPVFEVFFGGARGGGKTEASIGDWLQHSNEYGENAVGIFVRRKFKQLQEVIARTKQIFPKLGAKYNEQKAQWTMANGARLKFVYLERDSDAEEYQGHNYTRVYVEETTNFPSPAPIDKLRATLRSTAGVPCGMRLTGNPGGPGHNWVKKRYIDPAPKGYKVIWEETEVEINGKKTIVKLDRVFIPSKLGDNAMLMQNDPTYVLRLQQSGSAALVKAWLEGDWSIIDGAYFDEWDPGKHILHHSWLYRIPKNAMKFRAMDWGSAKPFSVGWYALSDGSWGLPNGALVKFQEWYGAKAPNVGLKMVVAAVAKGIVGGMLDGEQVRGRDGDHRISYSVADPSIFISDGGPSKAETFALHGCPWRAADNKRLPGWEALRNRLRGDSGVPMLYFLEDCEDTIRTLPVLQHDETDPEDLDTEGEDHAADETRYAVMSRPWIPKGALPPPSVLPKLPQQMTMNEMIAKLTEARKRRERASNLLD